MRSPLKNLFSAIALKLMTLVLSFAAWGGGQDLGGGHLVSGDKPSSTDLRTLLKKFEAHRFELLRALELNALFSERILAVEPELAVPLELNQKEDHLKSSEIGRLIFHQNSEEAYSRLSKVQLELSETGPCYDRQGNPTVGSIFGTSPDSICISLSEALPYIDVSTYEVEMLGLYMHELSHLYGSSEAQAHFIQQQVRSLGKNYDRHFSFLNGHEDLDAKLEALQKLMERLEMDSAEICPVLEELSDLMNRIFVEDNLKSQKILSQPLNRIARLHALFVLSVFTRDYCVSDLDPGKLMRQIKFAGGKSSRIQDLYPDPLSLIPPLDADQVKILSQYLLADLVDIEIVWTSQGDRSSLLKNLEAVKGLGFAPRDR